jgi:hypothetical protein
MHDALGDPLFPFIVAHEFDSNGLNHESSHALQRVAAYQADAPAT